MTNYFIRFFTILLFYIILLMFPFSSYIPLAEFSLQFYIEPESKQLYQAQNLEKQETSISQEIGIPFVKEASQEEKFSQFKVQRISSEGEKLSEFLIPSKKILQSDDKEITLYGKGFLTYPIDGSVFIWYPSLGQNIFFFDPQGKFLWSMQSTQYLKFFPSGKWILSVSGDHSRFQVKHPNLKSAIDVEGVLMNDFQIAPAHISSEISQVQACAGFLNGDVVFLDPEKSNVKRIHSKRLLKSLWCNFENKLFAVQLEEINAEKTPQDVLYIGNFLKFFSEKNSPKDVKFDSWIFSYPLEKYYPYKLPLAISQDAKTFSFLLPAEDEMPAKVTLVNIKSKKINFQVFLSNEESYEADDWRVETLENLFVFWNDSSFYIFEKSGLIFKKNCEKIYSLKVIKNYLYIDSSKGIFSYKI